MENLKDKKLFTIGFDIYDDLKWYPSQEEFEEVFIDYLDEKEKLVYSFIMTLNIKDIEHLICDGEYRKFYIEAIKEMLKRLYKKGMLIQKEENCYEDDEEFEEVYNNNFQFVNPYIYPIDGIDEYDEAFEMLENLCEEYDIELNNWYMFLD